MPGDAGHAFLISRKTFANALAIAALGWLAATSMVQGQSLPTEHVTVNGQKPAPEEKLHDFVRSYAVRAGVAGKMARWKTGICPLVSGLPEAHTKFVVARVREVAGLVGAPVGSPSCKTNIDIVFTLHPQVLLDDVRKQHHIFLGYHDAADEERLATVTHPVQAWYTTQTADLHGSTTIDDKLRNHGGFYMDTGDPKMPPVYFPDASAVRVTGSHLGDGLSSELYHVIIIVDLARVQGQTVGALTDYAAMLALAQTQSFEACAPVASIANLVSQGCEDEAKTEALTVNDLGYLQALYKTDPRTSFGHQQAEIVMRMNRDAEKQ